MNTADELSRGLRAVHDRAGHGQQTLMIYLFGIKYAGAIENAGVTPNELFKMAGLPKLGPTLNSGIKLSPLVSLSPQAIQLLDRLVNG